MPDAEVLALLNKQITAMNVIRQELGHIYLINNDLDQSDQIRAQLTDVNQLLFVLNTEANQLSDATLVVQPPTQRDLDDISLGLKQLDAYVRNDGNIHMAISYLMQVAKLVGPK